MTTPNSSESPKTIFWMMVFIIFNFARDFLFPFLFGALFHGAEAYGNNINGIAVFRIASTVGSLINFIILIVIALNLEHPTFKRILYFVIIASLLFYLQIFEFLFKAMID